MNLRRRRPEAPEAVEVVESDSEPETTVDAVDDVDADRSPTVRALRAQVRALEEALEVAPDVPVPTADEAAYRNRVLLAVRAVASRADDHDDPRHVAARVMAAVERLEVAGFSRPVLPGIASRTIAAPPPLPAAPTVADVGPDVEPDVEPADEPGEEIVLPVPPPAVEDPRRGRRRPRGTAA